MTPEQQEKLVPFQELWTDISLSTDEADWKTFEAGVLKVYKLSGLEIPDNFEFHHVASPRAALDLIAELSDDENPGRGNELWGCQDAYWVAPHLFNRDVCDGDYSEHDSDAFDAYAQIARAGFWWYPYEMGCVLVDRPPDLKTVERNDTLVLHSDEGPCVTFRDGWKVYAIFGTPCDPRVIEDPASYTVKEIMAEENVELRRVIMERFGYGRFIRESGAKSVDKSEHGQLYRIDVDDDDPLCVVRVYDSSPSGSWHVTNDACDTCGGTGFQDGLTAETFEQLSALETKNLVCKDCNGTAKESVFTPDLDEIGDVMYEQYWLGVPPEMKTAKEAVAWTFDKNPNEYEPRWES